MTDKDPRDMISDEKLMQELIWIATHREMTESRGMTKPVMDPKVKLSALEVLGRAKGMKGFKGVSGDDKSGQDHWKDLKKEMKKALGKAHGEKDAM